MGTALAPPPALTASGPANRDIHSSSHCTLQFAKAFCCHLASRVGLITTPWADRAGCAESSLQMWTLNQRTHVQGHARRQELQAPWSPASAQPCAGQGSSLSSTGSGLTPPPQDMGPREQGLVHRGAPGPGHSRCSVSKDGQSPSPGAGPAAAARSSSAPLWARRVLPVHLCPADPGTRRPQAPWVWRPRHSSSN